MITDQAKFLRLVTAHTIRPALKSFNDTLLFYYLGHLALKNVPGDLLEIGGGGSTFALTELSHNHQRKFNLCDIRPMFGDDLYSRQYFADAIVNPVIDNSENLSSHKLGSISYCHIDADKKYSITKGDIEYCLDNISENGLICQDDYGNNKWPTIGQVVDELKYEGNLKIVMIGDSSVWLTKPEYYDYWMNLLASSREFNVLSAYIGIQESELRIGHTPNYFYFNMSPWEPESVELHETGKTKFSQEELDSLKVIEEIRILSGKLPKSSKQYLVMPYPTQSIPGSWL